MKSKEIEKEKNLEKCKYEVNENFERMMQLIKHMDGLLETPH